jgi:sulfite exporter TauE/SafE
MKLDGFILGLSNGVVCIATCAPVLIPYLLAEGKGVVRNYWVTGQFLFGRLIGYLLFAVLAWTISSAILQEASQRNLIIGAAYVLFSGLLIFYGFFKKTDASCGAHSVGAIGGFSKIDTPRKNTSRIWDVFQRGKAACDQNKYQHLLAFWPALLPLAAGFATGLSFCPPFLLAFTGAVEQTSLVMSLLFFFSFFLGTSVLFVLAPFVGVFSRFSMLQIVGKMAAGLMGLYYLYSGIILILGGWKLL